MDAIVGSLDEEALLSDDDPIYNDVTLYQAQVQHLQDDGDSHLPPFAVKTKIDEMPCLHVRQKIKKCAKGNLLPKKIGQNQKYKRGSREYNKIPDLFKDDEYRREREKNRVAVTTCREKKRSEMRERLVPAEFIPDCVRLEQIDQRLAEIKVETTVLRRERKEVVQRMDVVEAMGGGAAGPSWAK